MRKVKVVIEHEYNEYDVGEKIRPTSSRSALPPGQHVVTKFYPPFAGEGKGTIFVEGHETGFSADYVMGVEGEEDVPITD